jgi:hypothetical protein
MSEEYNDPTIPGKPQIIWCTSPEEVDIVSEKIKNER